MDIGKNWRFPGFISGTEENLDIVSAHALCNMIEHGLGLQILRVVVAGGRAAATDDEYFVLRGGAAGD